MNIRKNKGITLIALVITIIILIILAGVSINMVMGDEGIFNVIKRQQEEMKISQITERLELEKANIAIDNIGKVNLDKYLENIKNNSNKVGEYEVTSVEKVENGIAKIVVDDKYQYLLEEEENGNVKITYEGEIGNLPPKIENVEVENTTNSIVVKVTGKRIEKYIFYIKEKNSEEEYKEKGNNESGEYTYTGLKANTEYSIKVEVTNGSNKNDDREINRTTTTMVNLEEAEVIYTKTNTNWTNQNVKTTISFNTEKNIEGYKIEYIKFGIEEEVTTEKLSKSTWLQYTTSGIISTQNEKIYSRLTDGYNTTSYTSTQISNIDKQEPNEFTISENSKTASSVTINAETTDNISEIDYYRYYYGDIYVDAGKNATITGLTAEKTYKIYVIAYDLAGNYRQSNTISVTTPRATLQIGDEISYSPSGTYNWQAKYYSSTKTEIADDVLLNSGTGQDFNITKWKVLSINETTGKVELVPSAPTKGSVYLEQAQGYNNGVKLLNDACSSLYGNTSKGIEARSINIEDIEKVIDYDPKTYTTNDGISYGEKWTTEAYSRDSTGAYIIYKNYPVIYGEEANREINGTGTTTGLGLSKQNRLYERNEGTSTISNIGAITNATSIRPTQTCYGGLNNSDYTSKLGDYASIILPKGSNTIYWVASRCVGLANNLCYFYMYCIYSGTLYPYYMYNSYSSTAGNTLALFPVVSLNSKLIEGDATNGFVVK